MVDRRLIRLIGDPAASSGGVHKEIEEELSNGAWHPPSMWDGFIGWLKLSGWK